MCVRGFFVLSIRAFVSQFIPIPDCQEFRHVTPPTASQAC
jgi:hypothetical protein